MKHGVALLQVIAVVALVPVAVVVGRLSYRIRRRKPFVVAASLLVGAGFALMALAPVWSAAEVDGEVGAETGADQRTPSSGTLPHDERPGPR